MDGADDDEKIRIFQGIADVIVQIAGDGQFFLVPEEPGDGFDLFLQRPGNVEPLQAPMDLGCDFDVIRVVAVGNEGIIVKAHGDPSIAIIVFLLYHKGKKRARKCGKSAWERWILASVGRKSKEK